MEKGNQVVHTKILVHWTLKESEPIDKESYINRLSSILKDGLRFGKVDESFNSKNGSIKINTNQNMLWRTGSDQANWLILFVIYLKTGVDLNLYRLFWGQKEQYSQAH